MGETNESIIVALLHVLDTLLHFETRALQRRPWSKIEHKFRTFIRTVKYGETWARCVSQLYQLRTGTNLSYTFDEALLGRHRDYKSGVRKAQYENRKPSTYVGRPDKP